VISERKISGLWSGQPNTVKLDELDAICAVLGYDVGEVLLPEPVAVPEPAAGQSLGAVAAARAVTRCRRSRQKAGARGQPGGRVPPRGFGGNRA